MRNKILAGDALLRLRDLDAGSVDCVVTSPPYWKMRDYSTSGQYGLEATPEEFIDNLVKVFREVRRVIKPQGTLWLNLGDTYIKDLRHPFYKTKDAGLIPHRVAMALQQDGWFVRADIVWHKTNAVPESVKDRPTRSHEYVFLLSKSARYYYNADAIRQAHKASSLNRMRYKISVSKVSGKIKASYSNLKKNCLHPRGANRRSVWSLATSTFRGEHFATFPESLAELCVKAGCPVGGVVLDPFGGSGTTALVAAKLGRKFISIDVNTTYVTMQKRRLKDYL
jgi:DNA modification methylase